MEKNKGTRAQGRPQKGGSSARPPKDETPKLSDLGVTKTQSSRWQRLASVPEKQFEAVVDRAKRKAVSVVEGASKRTRQEMRADLGITKVASCYFKTSAARLRCVVPDSR